MATTIEAARRAAQSLRTLTASLARVQRSGGRVANAAAALRTFGVTTAAKAQLGHFDRPSVFQAQAVPGRFDAPPGFGRRFDAPPFLQRGRPVPPLDPWRGWGAPPPVSFRLVGPLPGRPSFPSRRRA